VCSSDLVAAILAVMFAASLLLTGFVFAAPVSADEGEVQPLTYCWDYVAYSPCDCITHQYWEYWCHKCCNEPDYCPDGCCDIYCWWVERPDLEPCYCP